jgi:hypothetical protein
MRWAALDHRKHLFGCAQAAKVHTRPPTRSRASITVTTQPRRSSSRAAASPARPAPTISTEGRETTLLDLDMTVEVACPTIPAFRRSYTTLRTRFGGFFGAGSPMGFFRVFGGFIGGFCGFGGSFRSGCLRPV